MCVRQGRARAPPALQALALVLHTRLERVALHHLHTIAATHVAGNVRGQQASAAQSLMGTLHCVAQPPHPAVLELLATALVECNAWAAAHFLTWPGTPACTAATSTRERRLCVMCEAQLRAKFCTCCTLRPPGPSLNLTPRANFWRGLQLARLERPVVFDDPAVCTSAAGERRKRQHAQAQARGRSFGPHRSANG